MVKALPVLEDLSLVLSSHLQCLTTNCLQVQLQGIRLPLLVSTGTLHTWVNLRTCVLSPKHHTHHHQEQLNKRPKANILETRLADLCSCHLHDPSDAQRDAYCILQSHISQPSTLQGDLQGQG